MARKELLEKLEPGIFKGKYQGETAFFVTFKFNGKEYRQKNVTKLFGDKNKTAAKNRIAWAKEKLQNGIDPFETATKPVETQKDKLKEYGSIAEYIKEWTDERIKKRENSKSLKNCYFSYQKHMEPLLKNLTVDQFDTDTAIELFEQVKKNLKKANLGDHALDNIKKIMNPALKRLVGRKDGLRIDYNPLEHPDFLDEVPKAVVKKIALEYRIDAVNKTEAFIKLAQELYLKSANYEQPITRNKPQYANDLYRAAFLISIMCGRRVEEFVQTLDWKHITKNNLVLTTTKTGTIEEYPLPSEVVELLKPYKRKRGVIFEFRRETYLERFQDIINGLETEFRPGEKFVQHDKRVLIVSILTAKKWCDRNTADKLISHATKNVSNTYHNATDRLAIMEKYWDLLRGNIHQTNEKKKRRVTI